MKFARPADSVTARTAHIGPRTVTITDPSMIQRLARQMADVHPGTVVVLAGHKEAAR